MKKLLSILLCISMLVSLVPFVASADEDTPMDVDTLEKYGFNPDPSGYNTNALKPGTHPIDPKYDLYLGNNVTIKKYVGQKIENKVTILSPLKGFSTQLSNTNKYVSKEPTYYSATTGFASTSTGVDDYYAKVYFNSKMFSAGSAFDYINYTGVAGGHIQLSIYDSQGNAVVKGFETGGYVKTTDAIEMWEIEGLLSVTAGDFDGDGVDEIAVYTPNNADETSSGSIHSNISVGIFEFDADTKSLSAKQYLDLPSKNNSSDICEWEYSYNGGSKQFYCLPYVAFCAEDVSGDGIDDLMAVLNFSTWYRGGDGMKTYSTKQLINHNTYFASVLEAYEGTQDGNLKQSIKHRVLVTDGLGNDTKYRYVLRHANVTVGDVTAEGSKEIVIGGFYTRADYATQTSNSIVTANRLVWVDDKDSPRQIVGFTTYDNLKNKNTYDANGDYHWTVREEGNDYVYWFNDDSTDSGPITTPLCAFKQNGAGKPDTIFLGGQLFDYDTSTGALKFTRDCAPDDLYDGNKTSVTWMGQAVAANVANDMFGREMLMFTFYYKIKGEDYFTGKLLTLSTKTTGGFIKGGAELINYGNYTIFSKAENQQIIPLALLDGSGKTGYITYDGDNTDVYYSDVEVLAIMQAPPLYEELNDDTYIGNSATGFAKSKGSSEGISHGGALTAGVVAGFEQETSFLGLFKVAGAEYELSVTGTVSYEHSTETSYDYSTGFETAGTTDAVVVFAVPYVRYNCTMYVPEYKLPTKADYTELCAFRDELIKNMEQYINTGETQGSGSYVCGCRYYEYKYSSYITEDNFQEQQAVLYNVAEEIDFIEKAIAECGKGGTGEWGGTVQGAVLPYHYCIPQAPMVTTVDAKTYDAIADATPGLDKVYGNVFPEKYHPGDPNTYAHDKGQLNAVGDILEFADGSGDGYLSNSNTSAPGSVQSQTISVEKGTSDTIGWGAAIENTSLANVGGAKVGFTVTAEYNGSSVKTTTEGNEYSGAVVAFPEGTPADYNYRWKLVSYTSMINGKKVPVVGYITKMPASTPPSVAQNISVEGIKDKSATITWEDGTRKPDYYSISRVSYDSAGNAQYTDLPGEIVSEDGLCTYTLKNLQPSNTSYYAIESYYDNGQKSIASQIISVTTMPEGFAVVLSVDGIDEHVIYRPGKELEAKLHISGNEAYDTYYRWQIDDGSGWKNIRNQTDELYNFAISTYDDKCKIRCAATVFVGNNSYTLYSNPITLNCANYVAGHSIDWDSDVNSVTITSNAKAAPATIFLTARNADGVVTHINGQQSSADGVTFRLDDISDEDVVRVYIWNDKLAPVTIPFVK